MHWLFLLMALGALVLAFSTPHVWLLVVSLLVALLLLLLWTAAGSPHAWAIPSATPAA